MSKRNLWSDEETTCLLDIINERKVNQLLDGKKYKNKNIFCMVEEEMKKVGFDTKNAEQIILKWRKMKSEYMKAKNQNKLSGVGRNTCPFFDKLNEMLGTRPGSFEGIDTSRNRPISLPDSGCASEAQSSNSGKENTPVKKVRNKKTPYERSLAHCTKEFATLQENLQNNFLVKQKELVEYEHDLQKRHEADLLKDMMEKTENLLDRSREKFFSQMRNMHMEEMVVYEEDINRNN